MLKDKVMGNTIDDKKYYFQFNFIIINCLYYISKLAINKFLTY